MEIYFSLILAVRIAIGGDKGGDSMKFHFQICHPETSVFDVLIFCMYEGSDCPANMRRALNCFITDFTKMVEPDFRSGGHKVQFLLAVHILMIIVIFHFGVFRS